MEFLHLHILLDIGISFVLIIFCVYHAKRGAIIMCFHDFRNNSISTLIQWNRTKFEMYGAFSSKIC